MASWTTPVTHVTGDVLAVTDWNGLANDATFLYQAPYIQAYATATTSVATGTTTTIALGGAVTAYGFTLSSNNAVTPLTGTYWAAGEVSFGSSTYAADVSTALTQNGTALTGFGVYASPTSSALVLASASDTVGLTAFQDSGNTLTVGSGENSTYLHMAFVGSQ